MTAVEDENDWTAASIRAYQPDDRLPRRSFHALGGHVDLTMDLAPRSHRWLQGERLHDLDRGY